MREGTRPNVPISDPRARIECSPYLPSQGSPLTVSSRGGCLTPLTLVRDNETDLNPKSFIIDTGIPDLICLKSQMVRDSRSGWWGWVAVSGLTVPARGTLDSDFCLLPVLWLPSTCLISPILCLQPQLLAVPKGTLTSFLKHPAQESHQGLPPSPTAEGLILEISL